MKSDDVDPIVPAEQVGMDALALQRVRSAFRARIRRGASPGGQLVVRRHGKKVLSEATGIASGFRADEGGVVDVVTPRTRFLVLSATKAVTAFAIAMLEDRGLLDLDAPIAAVFPEFAAFGKAALTTRDVLVHQAGVLMPGLVSRPEDWTDWDKIRDHMVTTRPSVPRGTLVYHPFEYGWILGEVVERVTGAPIDVFVNDEIAAPAGLPRLRFRARPDDVDPLARAYWLGGRLVLSGADLSSRFEEVANSPGILGALVPAAGIVTDADTLARFYDLVLAGGVTASGQRLLSASTLRRYTRAGPVGFDVVNKVPFSVGLGFMTGARLPSLFGWRASESCFGHSGAFSTLAFGDHQTGLSVAMVTNGNRGFADLFWRCAPLSQALRDACE